jgi:hypothetical protein
MAFHHYYTNYSASPVLDAEGEDIGLDPRDERIVTAIATGLAVLVVAAIAVLIGMA